MLALDRDELARHLPLVDVLGKREDVTTLNAGDRMGHCAVAYTPERIQASPFVRFFEGHGGRYSRASCPFVAAFALLFFASSRASAAETFSDTETPPSNGNPTVPMSGAEAAQASAPNNAATKVLPRANTATKADERVPLAAPYADPAPEGFNGVWMGTTYRTRTGFFARASAGASYLHIFRSAESTQAAGTEAFTGSSSVDTVLTELELILGGSLSRDLGLGFIVRVGNATNAQLSTSGESIDLKGGLGVALLGLSGLVYLGPDSGWFLGASAGLESWTARLEEGALDEIGGNGVCVSLLGGRDFWLGGNWALGALARVDGGIATGNTERQVSQTQLQGSETDYSFKAALALALTYY